MSRRFLWVVGPSFALLAASLLSAHAFASFTVEIVVPACDPFTTPVDQPTDFQAVAYADGCQLPSGEVVWAWYFGDGSPPSTGNPTQHTFTETGQYPVTIIATYGEQQAQDSATAQVGGEPPPEPECELFCREGCPYPGGERVMDDIVCLTPAVCVKCPNDYELVGFWMEIVEGIWQPMEPLQGNFAPPGAAFAEYRAYWPWMGCLQNVPYRWRAAVQQTGMPPGPVEWVEHWFTRYDIVAVNRQDGILRYDPTEGSGLEQCSIPWGIDHRQVSCCEVHTKFSVCVKVFGLGGGLVWHTHLDNRTYNDSDTVTWSGETIPGYMGEVPVPKGIYTYRVLVANGGSLGEPETEFCQCEFFEDNFRVTPIDLEKAHWLKIGNVWASDFQWNYAHYPTRAAVTLHYTLSMDAGACRVRLYKPDLSEGDIIEPEDGLLDPDGGTHQQIVQFNVDPQMMGNYTFVVFATETQEAGYANRDLLPREARQNGAVCEIWPPAWGAVGLDYPVVMEMNMNNMSNTCLKWNSPYLDNTRYWGDWGLGLAQVEVVRDKLEKCAIVHTNTHATQDWLSFDHPEPEGEPELYNLMAWPGADEPEKHYYRIPNIGGPKAFDHCLFVFYTGCNTAMDAGGGMRPLMDATASKGADCVGGFEDLLMTAQLCMYLGRFWSETQWYGANMREADNRAMDEVMSLFPPSLWGGVDSFWCNNWDLRLRPARFGQASP
ncbi:MAG: hypothetical protein FJX75_08245 [Armatimonadetes bacterium]|nr:hypothetical protein [Armatimonadota bacterium]